MKGPHIIYSIKLIFKQISINKIFKVLSILFLFISTIFAQSWHLQNSGVDKTLNDIYFVDTLHGWAVGDSAIIIATTDGGETWQRQNSPVDTVILKKVFFVNENVGYTVGMSGTILSTKDGGTTWVENESSVDYSLWDISFANEDTGWVVGGDFFLTRKWGVILHTKDGGQTWEKQLETYSPSFFSSKLFTTISFVDKNNGWAFAGDYVDSFSPTYVYRTDNGGEEWSIVGVADAPLFEMSMIPFDTMWAGGFVFAKSDDGGLNWDYKGGNVAFGFVWDVQAINGKTGWVGAGSLLFTEDGMETKMDISPDSRFNLKAIANAGKDYLWAVGDSGIVIKYTSGITSIDDKYLYQIPSKFKLYQNYPNPFNPSTTIQYQIPKASFVTLKIYDLLGREIISLVNKEQPAGRYVVNFNASGLSSGIYFYRLRVISSNNNNLNNIQVKKMVLIK